MYHDTKKDRRHPLSYLWICESVMGFVGTILNGFVLKTFWIKRHTLNTSINAMTWYWCDMKELFQALSF